eukprot:CAMPEP_0204885036 /NCGR_PEP_ID=MMETSP1349-20130617/11493_1 /ASSEMBLY_ACC=CAM_ASM_000710 /TAXON_ID=215587 /ORGANISM="Aplanochytrium stocchinoi, Strain GSBS06" /LENGTH=62 /DNA_ID=CAMNT_0052046261 /DNA_START=617 /DNA_END=805 /DNA_ORIENTATION=+
MAEPITIHAGTIVRTLPTESSKRPAMGVQTTPTIDIPMNMDPTAEALKPNFSPESNKGSKVI